MALAACPKKAASGSCTAAADCLAAETCLAGRCLPSACGDRPCHAGQACVADVCVDEGCASVTCSGGPDLYVGGSVVNLAGSPHRRQARLTATGALDPAFQIGEGVGSATPQSLYVDGVSALLADEAGLFVGGRFATYDGLAVGHLVRLDPGGTLDPTFAAGSGFSENCRSLLLDGQGRLYCGGAQRSYNDAVVQFLVRLLPDGSLDPE